MYDKTYYAELYKNYISYTAIKDVLADIETIDYAIVKGVPLAVYLKQNDRVSSDIDFSASCSNSSFSVSSTLPRTNSLIWPLITSSFSCTIFSDMVYRLLSEWCIATSFYQNSANHVSFYPLFNLRNLSYLIKIRKRGISAATEECLLAVMALNLKRMVRAIFYKLIIQFIRAEAVFPRLSFSFCQQVPSLAIPC